MTNVERLAFNFKSLFDAIRIRNHIIEMFERADREPDPSIRGPLLTFVVAGGGFAGVELAGSINDFAHGILADYPNLRREEVSTVLVHSRDRILPELSESLARYAQRKMEARGVIVSFGNASGGRDAWRSGPERWRDLRGNAGLDGWHVAESVAQVAADR